MGGHQPAWPAPAHAAGDQAQLRTEQGWERRQLAATANSFLNISSENKNWAVPGGQCGVKEEDVLATLLCSLRLVSTGFVLLLPSPCAYVPRSRPGGRLWPEGAMEGSGLRVCCGLHHSLGAANVWSSCTGGTLVPSQSSPVGHEEGVCLCFLLVPQKFK